MVLTHQALKSPYNVNVDSQDICMLPVFAVGMDSGVILVLPLNVQVTIISNFVNTLVLLLTSKNYRKIILFCN